MIEKNGARTDKTNSGQRLDVSGLIAYAEVGQTGHTPLGVSCLSPTATKRLTSEAPARTREGVDQNL